jgi:hypothetical protein
MVASEFAVADQPLHHPSSAWIQMPVSLPNVTLTPHSLKMRFHIYNHPNVILYFTVISPHFLNLLVACGATMFPATN